jgi:diaminopimelate epimerase
MYLNFHKYQGTGNDFILIDNRKGGFKAELSLIADLCDRRFGIGADGLIVLQPESGYDFRMHYYNSDGNESTMCGNGGRCIVLFAQKLGIIKDEAQFIAIDGEHKAIIRHQEERTAFVGLQMKDVAGIEAKDGNWVLDTGSPHYVKFVEQVSALDVNGEGKKIRQSDPFVEKGINVNFVERKSSRLHMRTYERGVEAETLSCGTGVTAAAIAAHYAELIKQTDIAIKTPGGELEVSFEANTKGSYSNVWLSGEVAWVFSGQIEI